MSKTENQNVHVPIPERYALRFELVERACVHTVSRSLCGADVGRDGRLLVRLVLHVQDVPSDPAEEGFQQV